MSAAIAARDATADRLSPGPDAEALVANVVALLNAGRIQAAVAAVDDLVAVRGMPPVACAILGLVCLSAGAPDKALAWCDRALVAAPFLIQALTGRATALTELDRLPDADAAFARAFHAGCSDAGAFYKHGKVLVALLRHEAGLAAFQTALRLRPDYLEASLDRANLLDALDRSAEALAMLDAALTAHPGHAQLLNNRGVVLFRLGRLAKAIDSLDLAIAADPDLAEAHLNKGEVLVRQGRFAEALAVLDAALALRPHYGNALCARGIALKLLGHFDEAAHAFDEALAQDPDCAYARTNKGELSLLLGDFATGWSDYDARFATRGHERPVLAWPVPEWAGQPNPGRVLVFADQAAGDVLHFARYLPVLRETGADVTLVCRPRLQRILRSASRGLRVVDAPPTRGPFDFQVPLSNMPFACGTTLQTIPTAPYVAAEPELARLWGEKIGSHGFKIGLCWRGSQDWRSDPKRSVPLDLLRPLGAIEGARLICLQMADNVGADGDTMRAMGVETFEADLDTGPDGFVETAAVMANLDLIISCDTSIAHLAGAMGRPTFVLLQSVPEWRFLLEREDSPWYPSMRLFRQRELDQWEAPIARMVAAISEKVA